MRLRDRVPALQAVLAVTRWVGRAYGLLGRVYFGAGTVMALIQLLAFLHAPSWQGIPDAADNAVFGFFLWPVVLMARAPN